MPDSDTGFELTRLVDRASAPLELLGVSAHLFVRQLVEVVDGHCQTESYSYRLQVDETRDSWLVRWEYYRAPPRADYPYPLAHVHVNATFPDSRAAGRFHIPTARVPLELVITHLITEWGARPRTDDWRTVLNESIAGFRDRRKVD